MDADACAEVAQRTASTTLRNSTGAPSQGDVSLAFCWSHVRRRFYDHAVAEASPIANEALQRIALLYAIEKDIRGRFPNERRAVRQERSRPIVAKLEPWLRAKLALISRKSKLAEAIRYAIARWEGLCRLLGDGGFEIDSNTLERSIRPLALNRYNALFAGSDGGGDNWAVIATLVECCKLNDVEPYAYLVDVLTRIVNVHLNSAIDDCSSRPTNPSRPRLWPENTAYAAT
jgi:transposase